MSSWGGAIYEIVSGARSMKRRCEAVGAGTTFTTVLGTGSGEIMRTVARLVEEKRLRAVIDSEWRLQESKEAIERQKSGRCAGKVVIRVVEEAAVAEGGKD